MLHTPHKFKGRSPMSRPEAYDPQPGYQFQILTRNRLYSQAFEHCDYATSREEKNYLVNEYRIAYGPGWEFRSIVLPRKFWPQVAAK